MHSPKNIINKLTALWAFSECGIGGFIHAFKIPLSGFVLGALAIIVINQIALLSASKFKDILQSTFVVLMVKAAVSPHTPWPAYVAVGFQGLFGALLYAMLKVNIITNLLFAVMVMAESALQKVLLTTLVYGKSIWQALDIFFYAIVKEFGLVSNESFSKWIIFSYVLIYVIWGIFIGIWLNFAAKKINQNKDFVLSQYQNYRYSKDTGRFRPSKRKFKWLGFLFVVLFICSVFAIANTGNPWHMLLRTIVVILLLYGVVTPLFNRYIKKLRNKNKANKNIQYTLVQINTVKQKANTAYLMAKNNFGSIKAVYMFVLYLLILAMYAADKPNEE